MITLSANEIDEVFITGKVIGANYYADHNKLVFTVKNTNGKFYVEFHPFDGEVPIQYGDTVMVSGILFSTRAGKFDGAKIRARQVRVKNIEKEEGEEQ
jgi:hypothetical protein